MRLVLDVETSTHNKGHPFDPRNFLVSYSRMDAAGHSTFHYHSDPVFVRGIADVFDLATNLIGHNIKFDLHWAANHGIWVRSNCRVWDTAIAEFILSGQEARFISLNEALESYGEARKPDQVAEYWAAGVSTEAIPIGILEEYNKYDVEGTYALYQHQLRVMSPEQIRLCWLMGEDLKALQHAEWHGIRFDHGLADRKLEELRRGVVEVEQQLSGYLPEGIPREPGFNWDSGDQLSAFLYGGVIAYELRVFEDAIYKSGPRLGSMYQKPRLSRRDVEFERRFVPINGTELAKTAKEPEAKVRFYSTDASVLTKLSGGGKIGNHIRQLLSQRATVSKAREMVESIQEKSKEMGWQNGYIHGQFNQNVVVTGRLSSSGPNLQNTPLVVDELLVSRYVE